MAKCRCGNVAPKGGGLCSHCKSCELEMYEKWERTQEFSPWSPEAHYAEEAWMARAQL